MIYLASQSPRRSELLQQIGVPFKKLSCQIDETPGKGELPLDYVQRMAVEKAKAGWRCVIAGDLEHYVLLSADTIVVQEQDILGKPETPDDACRMLKRLSGTCHQVVTVVAVINDDRYLTEVSVTGVSFRALSDKMIMDYVASGETVDKAGAYAIQGLGAVFVERIEGSYSGVVGLPLAETSGLLSRFGISCWQS